jgi:hypothetical protein
VTQEAGLCPLCSLKHLAKAKELLNEARRGYPLHFWDALANLNLAEDELGVTYQELAGDIREERKRLEADPWYLVDFDRLISDVSETTGNDVRSVLEKKP